VLQQQQMISGRSEGERADGEKRQLNCAAAAAVAVVVRFDDGIPETNQQQIVYNTQLK